LLENTLIILSSDNGPVLFDGYWDGAIERNGAHRPAGSLRGGKYSRWEGGTRMPFIVSWPGRVKPGTSDALVGQVDIFRSIAALVGKDLPEDASPDGENVLPALLGESPHGRDYVVEEALAEVAIRKGDWKYIPPGTVMDRGGLDEWKKTVVKKPGLLFDLANDPGERTNLAGKHPAKLRELRELLKGIAPEKFRHVGSGDKSQRGF
jgi:arylsulfatase A-like enzyme